MYAIAAATLVVVFTSAACHMIGAPYPTAALQGPGACPLAPEFVRLQVVANSDSERDQSVKADVSAAVREVLTSGARQLTDADSAMALVSESLGLIEGRAAQVLVQSGCGYSAEVSVGTLDFPAKSYAGRVVPPGAYPALRVTLGDGRGANWWCVLFPPLCFIDAGSGLAGWQGTPADTVPLLKLEDLSPEVLAALLEVQGNAAAPVGGDGRAVVVRSWLWDQLRSIDWRAWLSGATSGYWPGSGAPEAGLPGAAGQPNSR